jgi:hypothetical protein
MTSDTTHPSNIIPFDGDKVQQLIENDDKDNNMLFMYNETVIFKDGNGINQEVTYLGPNLSDEILKHKIRTRNDTEFLVDGILLSSLDAPDIVTIPLTPEQYTVDLPKLMELELKQISESQSLDSDQQEFMELHHKLSHLLNLAMISLAEKGRIKKKFAKLKH